MATGLGTEEWPRDQALRDGHGDPELRDGCPPPINSSINSSFLTNPILAPADPMSGQTQATIALQEASQAQEVEAESREKAKLPVEWQCPDVWSDKKPGHRSCALLAEGFITLLSEVLSLAMLSCDKS